MSLVRPARLEDAQAIARIEIETWRSTYPGMLPDRVLIGMSERRQIASWASFLRQRPEDVWVSQTAKGSVTGFGNCGAQRDDLVDYAGEVYTLYVLPDEQGKGMGRQLLHALFGRLVESGHGSGLVWVIRENPSRFFYERLGGRQVMHRPIRVGGQPVDATAYGWRDLDALLASQGRSDDSRAGESPH